VHTPLDGFGLQCIWRNDFGLELRVENNGDLVDSRLSPGSEAPLLLIADQMKANLTEKSGEKISSQVSTAN
jgi:hypothetical protein